MDPDTDVVAGRAGSLAFWALGAAAFSLAAVVIAYWMVVPPVALGLVAVIVGGLHTGGTSRLLRAGDTATIPRRHVHRVANAGASEASFVLEVYPARHIESTIRSTFAVGRVLRPLARLLTKMEAR